MDVQIGSPTLNWEDQPNTVSYTRSLNTGSEKTSVNTSYAFFREVC